MESVIRVDNVSFVYNEGHSNEVVALKDLTMDVYRGEYVSIIGPNGSGKSTLVRHFNALLIPTSGDVWVMGMNTRDPSKTWEIRQRVGMTFQNPDNQIVASTVEEEVAFGPENLGLDPADIRLRVEKALEAVGLADLRRNPTYALSGGQKQLLAIAAVLALRPRCIILDEATSMLDPAGRAEVLEAIRRLNREEGLTVIHVTHQMEEAAAADRVIALSGGEIAAQGTAREVFGNPKLLHAIGLDVPSITRLGGELLRRGISVSKVVLTVDELAGELCRLS